MRTATLMMAVLATACWRGPDVGMEHEQMLSPDGGRVMAFHELVDEVFGQSCATSFCHKPDPPPAAPMSLEAEKAYSEIVGVDASQEPSMKRIEPGFPEKSWLVIKLREQTAAMNGTTRMPLNKPQLTEETIEQIEQWILRGAPND